MANNSSNGGLLGGALGGFSFLFFFLFLNLPFWLSALIGAAAWGAGLILWPKRADEVENGLGGALIEGRRKLRQIRRRGQALGDQSVTEAVEAIAGVADRILAEAGSDPRSLKKARPFLTYYLDSTAKILDLYAGLKAQALEDDDVARTLGRVEAMLASLRLAFEKLLTRLLADDVMDLDTEVALLEQTMKMEGLQK